MERRMVCNAEWCKRNGSAVGTVEPFPPIRTREKGFTLVEVVLGALTIVIAVTAILGAYLGQNVLNEHARNLSLAIEDAGRVIEQIRQSNTGAGCNLSVCPPGGCGADNSWDAWLGGPGGGKSIQPAPLVNERIVVTCQDRDGGSAATDYCGDVNQVGQGEWSTVGGQGRQAGLNTSFNPIRVTVAVCWRHRGRTLGECSAGGALAPDENVVVPSDTLGVIDSPAMLTTLVTCRG